MGKMNNKKLIYTVILSVVLFAGNIAFAQTNELLRMDVKKASTDDTVDVVFYTTGSPSNTVVSRKEGNKYVVLLPNVSGNQSVVPSLGGVKDLVSNVNVKTIDDGIGGYTKITFDTVKPLKIQTYSQKTAPLSKAQMDYKTLIAKNSIYDPNNKLEKAKQTKINNTETKTTTNTVKTKIKQTQEKTTKTDKNKNILESIVPKIKQNVVKTEEAKKNINQTNTPKVNQTEKIQPKVSDKKDQLLQTTSTATTEPAFDLKKPPVESVIAQSAVAEQPNKKIKFKTAGKNLPIIPVAGVCSVIGLFILGLLMNIIAKSINKNSNKLKEYLENYNSENEQEKETNYNDILEKNNLNWQEKYKLYSERKERETQEQPKESYVTDISGQNGNIVSNDLETRISQMEHALSNAPQQAPSEQKLNNIQSEEDVIVRQMSGLNLKSFAKNINLKKTNRYNILPESNVFQTNPLKEGKYVNLENSELTMSQRNIGGHGFGISDLLKTGRRFLSEKRLSENVSDKTEQYSISSLLDYLNILDSEEEQQSKDVTNPISKSKKSDLQKNDAVSVVSRYDIDNNKSILMVNSEGSTALVGKIDDNVFILKKFNNIVNKPLQVRLDYGSVYIVKAGDFKCLVDVAEDKMGTLLEI